ncbi:hypothetical protein GLA29479_3754 [Lysobacter antibioticus]|uniref:hypothetical protein n=1 Tax=Lysobacter antibioticus TaxID=84531 RepID=UPI00071EA755|nr:hypothetical protein [Lysobacter antibioticus]ALN64605.1 hypothetical protein GLA29479_3754 [Lysobacter antibioticus]
MSHTPRLLERYPNGDGIYTELRLLSSADLDSQIQNYRALAREHDRHAEALIEYRNRVFDHSRHGR